GLIVLEVAGVASDSLSALVRVGGILTDRKGAAFPDSDLRTPAVTPKDEEDLEFGRELGVDWVAASFVRTGDDVRQVQALCGLAPRSEERRVGKGGRWGSAPWRDDKQSGWAR